MTAVWSTQSATREYQMGANGDLTVVERLASLLETGLFADVTIRCGSGKGAATFKAHRLLLATASSPLQKLMASHEGLGSVVHMEDVEPEAFQHFLKYIYTDNIQISSISEALSLLRMSKNWCLQKLKERTIKYLDGFLETFEPSSEDKKNQLCDLVILTEQEEFPELNKKCWETLILNVNKVVPCQGFLNMNQNHLRKLLSHENFIYKNHLVLFEAIRDWGMNQVLMRHLKVNQLQEVIGSLLQFVNFKSIENGDFMNTILPSDCLGKGDLIAFFMAKGLDIPRDLAMGQEGPESDNTYDKTRRFKRGYKLEDKEIYKEHELRFRVDQKLKLLGVGFGFLFSNTDMGITVHCQGPWETRQWSDIIQTYCRVTWDKMKTADVRLMFSEPVTIEANHCYKILVRVTRMSAGAGSVDLWGGTQGTPSLKTENAEFCFLKSAVPPDESVEDEDKDNTPGMVTDLFYELLDKNDTEVTTINGSAISQDSRELTPPRPLSVHRSQKKSDTSAPRRMSTDKIEAFLNGNGSSSPTGSPTPKPYGTVRKLSITKIEEQLNADAPSWMKKKYETRPTLYSKGNVSDRIPSFLRSQQPSSETTRPAWQIPDNSKDDSPKTRESSVSREPSISKYGTSSVSSRFGSSRYSSRTSSILDSTPRYSSSLSTSRYTPSYTSRYGSGLSDSSRSKYGSTSGTASSESNATTKLSGASNDTGTKAAEPTSKYGTSSRYALSSRLINNDSAASTTSRYGTSSTAGSSSQNGINSSATSTLGSDSSSTTSKYRPYSSGLYSSRYGTSTTSATTSSPTTKAREPTPTKQFSSLGTSRYSRTTATAPSTVTRDSTPSRNYSGLTSSRYGSTTSATSSPSIKTRERTPIRQFSGPSRYGSTTSSLGSSYSSRFGSSYYRR